jgi:hypothetical protein
MKYLKKFNEELRSQTYLRASYKRKKSAEQLTGRNKENALKSAADLHDWAGKTELKESYKSWEEKVSIYSKYGKINGYVAGEPIDFYYDITFDSMSFSDGFEDEKGKNSNEFSSSIPLMVWMIPTTKEDVDKCLETLPSDYFGSGAFQTFYINIDFKVENDEVKFEDLVVYTEDEVGIELTPNAGFKLKEMLVKLFSDKSLNYPSSVNDYATEYENIDATMSIENGMSVDYGFEIKDVANYIKTLPKQKFISQQ